MTDRIIMNCIIFVEKIYMGYYKNNQKKFDLKIATLITEPTINSLNQFLTKNFDNIEYVGTTSDGTEMTFCSVDSLLSYSNFKKRNLVGLKVKCDSVDRNLYIDISCYRRIFPETITYFLQYDNREWGFYFEDELIERLKEFKPWYNILTFTNLTFGIPGIFILCFLFISAVDYFSKLLGYSGFLSIDYNSNSTNNPIVGYIFWIPILTFCYIINVIRNYLFPLVFIATGNQKKEYAKRQKISYFIFVVIGLGIVINIISSYLIH